MGLEISGFSSEKEWSYSYTPLHFIRFLACKIDGYEGEFVGFSEYEGQKCWEKHKQFWQLLHFSDAEGVFVPESFLDDIDYEQSFYLGNSDKLLKELEHIKEAVAREPQKYGKLIDMDVFWNLYDLVKEEVDEGYGIIRLS